MDQAIPISAIQHELAQRRKELADLNARQHNLELEIAILERWAGKAGYAAPSSNADKLGPTDAVRQVVRDNPHGIAWKALIDSAEKIVKTEPSKARKTLDQTIRNLMNRDLREENDLIFPKGNENGH